MIESHEYQIHLTGTGTKTGVAESVQAGLPLLEVASPPEFGGPDSTWSPEHLFVASISACLMTTFRAIADMTGLEVLEYHDDATGNLVRGLDGLYRIDRVTLRPRVVIPEGTDTGKALRLVEKAEKVCLISRSVASRIDVEATVVVAQLSPAKL